MLTSIVRHLNERRDAKLEGEADAGFTLIELMVVLLIMAILLAIAIPTFLGVKGGAQDRSAQQNLNTALTNAKAVYGNNQSYGTYSAGPPVVMRVDALKASLTASEPALTFDTDAVASTGQNHISVAVDGTGNGIILVAESATNVCWGILTNETTAQAAAVAGTDDTTAIAAWPQAANAGTYYASWTSTFGVCSADVGSGITTSGTHNTAWVANKFPTAAT